MAAIEAMSMTRIIIRLAPGRRASERFRGAPTFLKAIRLPL
jgi:hypothetical protein